MSFPSETQSKTTGEAAKLLHIYGRLLSQLELVREELRAPGTKALVRELRRRTGSETREEVADVSSAVEEAIRALKVSRSELESASVDLVTDARIDGVENLPATLARFLAERGRSPGFTYRVAQDEIRGWVMRWKEISENGVVRGCGQFYERPYAWLED